MGSGTHPHECNKINSKSTIAKYRDKLKATPLIGHSMRGLKDTECRKEERKSVLLGPYPEMVSHGQYWIADVALWTPHRCTVITKLRHSIDLFLSSGTCTLT